MHRLWRSWRYVAIGFGQTNETAADLAAGYLPELIRLDTTNPPGNETRVAQYLKQVADREGIPAELLGDDPNRLNFVARLKGSGKQRPLLLIAHSDVVPADRSQWSVDPLAGRRRAATSTAAAPRTTSHCWPPNWRCWWNCTARNVALDRDIILLSEADEEAGSLGAAVARSACLGEDRRRVRAQ